MQFFKPRILLVDDNADSCEIVTIWLTEAGYEVVLAHTAAEALNKTLTGDFDLLLLENHLPDGSGLELYQQIREIKNYTPICFYTCDGFPKQIEAALRAGANAYLVKPVFPDDLERVVRQLLG
jgi:DNA-binding response OmpR family regulator